MRPIDETSTDIRDCLCQPIGMDNCLQVAGIHLNCLTNCGASELYICSGIEDLSMSSDFTTQAKNGRPWTVYSKYEPTSEAVVTADIFALVPESGQVAVAIMGALFQRVSLTSLKQALARHNGVGTSNALNKRSAASLTLSKNDEIHHSAAVYQSDEGASKRNDSSSLSRPAGDETFVRIQHLLSDIVRIPVSNVKHDSSLVDIGIDSLLVTELTGEVKRVFGCDVAAEGISNAWCVDGIVRLITHSECAQNSGQRVHPKSEQQVEDEERLPAFQSEAQESDLTRSTVSQSREEFSSIAKAVLITKGSGMTRLRDRRHSLDSVQMSILCKLSS